MLRLLLIACMCVFSAQSMAQGVLPDLERGYHNMAPFTPRQRPHIPMSPARPYDPSAYEKEDLVAQARPCLGKYQCLHEKLHPAYSVAFAQLGCHCHTGRCRPSTYRVVPISVSNDTGIQVFANDQWCDVMQTTLRRNKSKIPPILLQFPAHVCVGMKGCAELECAIVALDG